MVSPCPPSTQAVTSSTETLNSWARKVRKRALSSTPAMPTTMLCGRPGLAHHPDHGIERIGDDDDERLRAVLLDGSADLANHLRVDAQQIVAAHPGLARHAGGDDHDVGALDVVVAVRAEEARVVVFDRSG